MAWSGRLSPADFVGHEEFIHRYQNSVVRGATRCCGAAVYQLRYESSGGAVLFNGQRQRINSCPLCGTIITDQWEPIADETRRYFSEAV